MAVVCPEQRVRQGFSGVQWVTTQWRAAPDGDANGDCAFVGDSRIEVRPEFFQRLDGKVEVLEAASLFCVPVLLWANQAGDPGQALTEDQAVLLARYMVARWAAFPVLWILPGDSNYGDQKAPRWHRIGSKGVRPRTPRASGSALLRDAPAHRGIPR